MKIYGVRNYFFRWLLLVVALASLVACGSGSGSSSVTVCDFDSMTLADIQAVTLSSANINGSNDSSNEIPAGTIVVYQTNEGRYGKFVVATYGYNLVINWVTYDLANDGTVFSQGNSLTIEGTCLADLDAGVQTTDNKIDDFFWEQVTATERYIVPNNGATFAVYCRVGSGGR